MRQYNSVSMEAEMNVSTMQIVNCKFDMMKLTNINVKCNNVFGKIMSKLNDLNKLRIYTDVFECNISLR